MSNLLKKENLGFTEGYASIILNTLLFGLKYWAGILTGSIAIIADAWHTFSDSLTSLVVIIGFKVTRKPADKEHPFGHGRAELIASLIIAILLVIVGFNFIVEAFNKIKGKESAEFHVVAVIVMACSVVLKEAIASFSFWAAKKTDSQALKADGWHHRSDAVASIIILAGIFLGKWIWWLDGFLGIVVALLILWVSYGILKNAISSLLGEHPGREFENEVIKLAHSATTMDVQLHHIHLHQYGDHKELTCHIKLNPQMNLKEAHDIATVIEKKILDEMNIIATIHIEPAAVY